MAKKELIEQVPGAKPHSTPTPENTPPPGGGRYRWDIAKPGWVDIDAVPVLQDLPVLPTE